MVRRTKTSSSKKRRKSSKKPKPLRLPLVAFSALILSSIILLLVIVQFQPTPVVTWLDEVRAILQGHGLTPETVGHSGNLVLWKINLGKNTARYGRCIQAIREQLDQRALVTERTLVTEAGGYGLSSQEIIVNDQKLILYFVSSRGKTEKKVKLTRSIERAGKPMAAIIIDDIGYRRSDLSFFRKNRYPLTAAVLPGLPHSSELSVKLDELGYEVICHQPMEPSSYPRHDPGPGVILLSMTPEEIGRTLEANLKTVPTAKGLNNHMGSAFTADRLAMEALMDEVRRLNLYLVDSRTTADTVAENVAREMNVPVIARDVFLDDLAEEHYIARQVREYEKVLLDQGYGVAICHPHHATFSVLEEVLPRLAERYDLVTVGGLLSILNN